MSYQTQPLSPKMRNYLRKVLPGVLYRRYFGRHEKMSLRIWRLLAAAVPKNTVVLDIGAFHGEFAVAARNVNESCEIYAFEPNPDSLEVLRPVAQNKRFKIVETAVSDKNETVHFYCNRQISSIVRENSSENSIEVQARTLDSWMQAMRRSPFLMKIDVEDAAAEVLRGASKLLAEHRPLIICEILNDQIGAAAKTVLPHDYSFYYINENKGLELKTEVRRADWRYKNWLFLPQEKTFLLNRKLISKNA
jgi:FkbM family methyltransferase